jgi:hypothetical protein
MISPSSTAKASVRPIAKPEKREKAPSRLSRKTELKPKRAKRARRAGRNAIYTYACDISGEVETCWLAQFSDEPCAGRMTKAHLLSKAAIRKEIWNQRDTLPIPRELFPATLRQLQDDRRCWRPACWSHHQALDFSRKLRIPRERLPREVEEYAEQYLVAWLLERTYGSIPQLQGAASCQ